MTPLQLTAEQQRIVDHPLEPLRVSAGAGTGKTTTVVLRLKAAIEAGIEPERALGITFTNKAAEELAARLRIELPTLAGDGREAPVTTYHGFAYGLLREFGAFVGMERTATVIGPGYQRQLLEESLTGGSYRYLDLTHPAGRVTDAAMLARQLGDNLLTPADVLEVGVATDDEVGSLRRELLILLDDYAATKQRLDVVDYGDLIRLAHRLVTEHPEIATRIRDRFEIVLLDEYQDTDPGQRTFLQRIFGTGFPITAVGDASQTIYEWRGASRRNFTAFPSHFRDDNGSPAGSLPLTVNRRSDRSILDLANRLQEEIHPGGDFERLTPTPGAGAGSIEAAWFRTEAEEAAWIGDRIRALHDDGIAWGDIAVLFRKNQSIRIVRDALDSAAVPIEVVSLGGLLTVPEVADLHAWLRIIDDPEDSSGLARILLGGKYRLGLADLATLRRWHTSIGGTDHTLLEAIDQIPDGSGLTPEAERRLADFRRSYRELLVDAQGVTLVELCRLVLDVMGAWTEVEALEEHAALSARLNLYRFLDLAGAWSPLQGRPSLTAFLHYLTVLDDESAAEELDRASISHPDAVALLTVHRAKGLEWDTVLLPALTEGTFPARSRGFDDPGRAPRYLPYELRIDGGDAPELTDADDTSRRDALRERHLLQEWRTAYVAVTRAATRLVATGAWWGEGKRPRRPSPLYTIVADLPATITVRPPADAGSRPDRTTGLPRPPAPDPLFPDGWAAAVRRAAADPSWLSTYPASMADAAEQAAEQLRLALDELPSPPEPNHAADLTTSVTGLVTLATCPKRFFWSEVDRLPRRSSPSRRHGVEFHRKVELHNLGIMPLAAADDATYDVPDEATSRSRTDHDPYGTFLRSRFANVAPRFVEVPIDLALGDARVRGRIDAVYEPVPERWEIVDYKSGRFRADPATRVQLQAYALAAASGAVTPSPPDEIDVTFAYFGGDEAEEATETVDTEWLVAARHDLGALVDRASGGTFPETPSRSCATCDFVKFCEPGREFLATS